MVIVFVTLTKNNINEKNPTLPKGDNFLKNQRLQSFRMVTAIFFSLP